MGDIIHEPTFNRHQYEFYEDVLTKLLHLSGGYGCGKTYGLIWKLIQLSKINHKTHGGLVVPSFPDFTKDVEPELEKIFDEEEIPYSYNKKYHYFKFPWTQKKVFVCSGERKIRGPTWGYALINELTLIPLIRYKEVIGRVRDKNADALQIASSGTPEGMASEYYDYQLHALCIFQSLDHKTP